MPSKFVFREHPQYPGYDIFGRDFTWMTDSFLEEYAGAALRKAEHAEIVLVKYTKNDPVKKRNFYELLTDNHHIIQQIQDQLTEEYGEEYFIGRAKSKDYHIRQLELAIEEEKDNKVKALLYKELRELRGWSLKPAEKSIENVINLNKPNAGNVTLDRNNPREAERIVMSIFGSV